MICFDTNVSFNGYRCSAGQLKISCGGLGCFDDAIALLYLCDMASCAFSLGFWDMPQFASKIQVKQSLLTLFLERLGLVARKSQHRHLDEGLEGPKMSTDRGITVLHPTSWGRAWHVAKQHLSQLRCRTACRSDGTSIRDPGWPG